MLERMPSLLSRDVIAIRTKQQITELYTEYIAALSGQSMYPTVLLGPRTTTTVEPLSTHGIRASGLYKSVDGKSFKAVQ